MFGLQLFLSKTKIGIDNLFAKMFWNPKLKEIIISSVSNKDQIHCSYVENMSRKN